MAAEELHASPNRTQLQQCHCAVPEFQGAVPRDQWERAIRPQCNGNLSIIFLTPLSFGLEIDGVHCHFDMMRYVVCSLDFTVWPADGVYVQNSLSALSAIAAMSESHVGIVQYPVLQSQTSRAALMKHKHMLENNLLKNGLTSTHCVQILYHKPDSSQRDQRALNQLALAVFHEHFEAPAFTESKAVREGKCGPCPLLPITQFIGYDEACKLGASARVEQSLGFQSSRLPIFS